MTRLHNEAHILNTDYGENGTLVEAELPVTEAEPYLPYEIKE